MRGSDMELTLYQIDAFADRPFTGNPAAICPLTEWLPDDVMLTTLASAAPNPQSIEAV